MKIISKSFALLILFLLLINTLGFSQSKKNICRFGVNNNFSHSEQYPNIEQMIKANNYHNKTQNYFKNQINQESLKSHDRTKVSTSSEGEIKNETSNLEEVDLCRGKGED